MGGFLYWLPAMQGLVTRENVAGTALASVLGGASIISATANNPEGQPGALAAAAGTKLAWNKSAQVWARGLRGEFSLGYWTDAVPTPGDLARETIIAGHAVTLADGNEWIVPVARAFPAGTRLPEALVLGENGEVVSEALPEYAAISADAERIWGEMAALGSGETSSADEIEGITIGAAWNICVKALAINYRVDREEVSALRLLTTQNQADVIQALIDWPTVCEFVKKNRPAPDGPPSSVGGQVS